MKRVYRLLKKKKYRCYYRGTIAEELHGRVMVRARVRVSTVGCAHGEHAVRNGVDGFVQGELGRQGSRLSWVHICVGLRFEVVSAGVRVTLRLLRMGQG